MGKEKFEIGSRFLFDGEVCELVGMQGATLRFRSGGALSVAKTSEVIEAADFRVLHSDDEGEGDEAESRGPLQLVLENGTALADYEEAWAEAQAWEPHINEMITGYRSGDPAQPAKGEPRQDYDPASTSLNDRVTQKVADLEGTPFACKERQLRRKIAAYRSDGLTGLVDRRKTKLARPLMKVDAKILTAAVAVLDKLARKTKVSKAEKCRQIKQYLDKEYGEKAPALPSESTMNRLLEVLSAGRGFHLSAKQMRSVANQPVTPYRNFSRLARRPGEYVLLDSTPLDVFAIDPVSYNWVRVTLTIAIDLFTRSILAWRLTASDPKGVDAALLLADVIKPKEMGSGWSSTAQWRYHGVPENVVVAIWPNVGAPAGIPVTVPETVVIDHGKVFVSQTFTDACRRLGINVQLARPYTPTDKAVVERFFKTIRLSLLEKLAGYKGPDVWSRGKDVQAGAFWFLNELDEIIGEWLATFYQVRHHDGLEIAGAERLNLSPNDAYDIGLATCGFLYVPPSPTLYYELLPVVYRTIQDYGVQLFNLRYDGEGLDGIDPKDRYRNAKSPHKGAHRGLWRISYDPRDLSKVYFQRRDGSWHVLRWAGDVGFEQPFADIHLGRAKQLVIERGGSLRNHDDLARVLNELVGRLKAREYDNEEERRLTVKALARTAAARRDQEEAASLSGLPAPLRLLDDPEDYPEDADEFDLVDDEDFGGAEADPFDDIPLLAVAGDVAYTDGYEETAE